MMGTQENLKKHINQLSENNTQEIIQKLSGKKGKGNIGVGWTPGRLDMIF